MDVMSFYTSFALVDDVFYNMFFDIYHINVSSSVLSNHLYSIFNYIGKIKCKRCHKHTHIFSVYDQSYTVNKDFLMNKNASHQRTFMLSLDF